MKIERVIRKYKLGEEPDDMDYWLEQPPLEKLKATEFLRQQYYALKYGGVRPEFQRVYRIVRRQSG